jgi:hypothetical protein
MRRLPGKAKRQTEMSSHQGGNQRDPFHVIIEARRRLQSQQNFYMFPNRRP